nr:hypothetical protein [Streptomyces sp. HB202]
MTAPPGAAVGLVGGLLHEVAGDDVPVTVLVDVGDGRLVPARDLAGRLEAGLSALVEDAARRVRLPGVLLAHDQEVGGPVGVDVPRDDPVGVDAGLVLRVDADETRRLAAAGDRPLEDVELRCGEVHGGQVGASVSVEVAGGQGPAQLVPVLRQRRGDVDGRGEALRATPDDGDGAEGVGLADPLGVHADDQIGVAVAVEVTGGETVAEVVPVLRRARDPRGGLADDGALGRVEAVLGAVHDGHVAGVGGLAHLAERRGDGEVAVAVTVEVAGYPGRRGGGAASADEEQAADEGGRGGGHHGGAQVLLHACLLLLRHAGRRYGRPVRCCRPDCGRARPGSRQGSRPGVRVVRCR